MTKEIQNPKAEKYVVCFRGNGLRFLRMETERPAVLLANEALPATEFESAAEAIQAVRVARLSWDSITIVKAAAETLTADSAESCRTGDADGVGVKKL